MCRHAGLKEALPLPRDSPLRLGLSLAVEATEVNPSSIGHFPTSLATLQQSDFKVGFALTTLRSSHPLQCANKMSGARSRLAKLASHFLPASASPQVPDGPDAEFTHRHHFHTLSPTFFLARAAQIEPEVSRTIDMTEFDCNAHWRVRLLPSIIARQTIKFYGEHTRRRPIEREASLIMSKRRDMARLGSYAQIHRLF